MIGCSLSHVKKFGCRPSKIPSNERERKGADLSGRRGREDLGDVLIEGATVGLAKNLALEEFLGMH